jgi:hypothetical protein
MQNVHQSAHNFTHAIRGSVTAAAKNFDQIYSKTYQQYQIE